MFFYVYNMLCRKERKHEKTDKHHFNNCNNFIIMRGLYRCNQSSKQKIKSIRG